MRVALKIAAVAGAAATALAVGLGPAAVADPTSRTAPSLTTLTGVGSDTLTPLFDNGTGPKSPACKGGATGSFVHDYNATSPPYAIASWDAVNPCTGAVNQDIITKAKAKSDTSCTLERPNGSSAGIATLNDDQTDENTASGGQTVYCVDYVRSSRGPNDDTFMDAFSALAQDALTWVIPIVAGEANPQPASLTQAQLAAIYTCTDTNWDQVGGSDAPIGVVIPQSGSGTRSSWLGDLGITASSEPCWQNGTVDVDGTTDVIEENTGLSPGNVAQFTTTQDFGTTCADGCEAADDIFPYSIGDWIAQTSPAVNGVGGHASSIWGHGNLSLKDIENAAGTKALAPITKNSAGQPVINPAWIITFVRILYIVVRNGCYSEDDPTSDMVCLPATTSPVEGGSNYPKYEVKGLAKFLTWTCTNPTAKKDILSYGFTNLSAKTLQTCGNLTAGD
jgi:hypothetical protein